MNNGAGWFGVSKTSGLSMIDGWIVSPVSSLSYLKLNYLFSTVEPLCKLNYIRKVSGRNIQGLSSVRMSAHKERGKGRKGNPS